MAIFGRQLTFAGYARGFYLDAIAGRRTDFLSGAIRSVAYLLSAPYGSIVTIRNQLYERGVLKSRRLPVPVISVGNITCGGTGKTPLVELVAKRLISLGKRPAIVSRGYSAREGRNDESVVLRQNLPSVPQVLNPDRIAGGMRATTEYGADCVILDDGFQHLKVERDVDIVVVDALNPFGYGFLIPRGLLREPVKGLRRADLIVLSHSNQVGKEKLARLCDFIAGICPGVPVLRAAHEAVALVNRNGARLDCDWLKGRRVVGFCGIGNPDSFRITLQMSGARLVGWKAFPDHYPYRTSDLKSIEELARETEAEAVVFTQKDAVKMPFHFGSDVPFLELRVRIVLPAPDAKVLNDVLLSSLQHG